MSLLARSSMLSRSPAGRREDFVSHVRPHTIASHQRAA
jgi:hypothetical protein